MSQYDNKTRNCDLKKPHMCFLLFNVFVFTIVAIQPQLVTASDDTFFTNQVAPILQQRCLSCHNNREQKGDFSLETSQGAFADGYIDPKNSADSHLIDLVTPVDGKAQMPKNADPLTAEQIAVLSKWIDSGAKWPADLKLEKPKIADLNWWSLEPLQRPQVPTIENDWVRTPIDAFIAAKYEEQKLSPSPRANRLTLIRRLYFDLIGLPPTPTEIEAFVNNESPHAYEQLVDQLLDSKRYGERWARHWLDVVHYADTHGYDKDKLRNHAWPYRDYVIQSLNNDKPYSRFVKEQIAGDALWPDTVDGLTATGFIAAGPWDFIGHVEVPDTKIDGKIARHLDRDDMVTTTMNTFCSTTVQCARCHNHKFDPIAQKHYYSLQAVFAALDRADRSYDADPETTKRRSRLNKDYKQYQTEQGELAEAVKKAAGEQLAVFDAQILELEKQLESSADPKPEFGFHSHSALTNDTPKWVQVDLGQSTPIQSIVIVGCHDDFNGIGHGFGFPVRYKIEVSEDPEFKSGIFVLQDNTQDDVPNPGTKPQVIEVDGGISTRYVRVTATKLATRKDDFIFALAELRVLTPENQNAAINKTVSSLDSIEAPVRWSRKNLVDGYYYGVGNNPQTATELARLQDERQSLLEEKIGDELQSRLDANATALAETKKHIDQLPPQLKVYSGMVHHGKGAFIGTGRNNGQPRPIHVLHRGNILQPREEVKAGTIPIMANANWEFELPESHTESDRRIALANWIVHNDNPLTWRSIVNRVWQYHFDTGIVDTPNDLGRMGSKPSHPELLDWLAVEFRDGGQSLKKLHKLIVMSAVYQQTSDDNHAYHELDSNNVYLWRMKRRRLTAEELRDAVLQVSGALNEKMYGPGFQLFVIDHPEHSPHYEYVKHDPTDPKSHRRSIYRFIVRSQPDPFMTTLDCADSSQSVAKRDETITALQALSLLNNPFMLHMAERFSQRLKTSTQDKKEQVRQAFQLITGRNPSEEQATLLSAYAQEHGLTNLCRILFNLNEFVFVD